MAGITLEQAEAQLAAWLTANEKVARGQSYTIGDRSLTRADARTIMEQIKFWQGQVKALERGESGSVRLRGITPA